MSAQKEIEKLREDLTRHERLYYVDHSPEISDYEFDLMMRRLIELEEKHPELKTDDSPSVRVGGAPIESFETVIHDPPMLSIENAYSFDELFEWDARVRKGLGLERVEYLAELKIDGLSIDLLYEKGKLVRGATRGDGVRGDDVTPNVKTVRSLPLSVDNRFETLEVRGEIYMDKNDFAELNAIRQDDGQPLLANPRNAAAGAIRMKDPRLVAERRLRAIIYQVVRADGVRLASQSDASRLLRELGFPVNPGQALCPDIETVTHFLEEWRETRHSIPFEIDGIVVKVNDRELQGELGQTSKSPRWAVAFKYPPEAARTVIRSIGAQVGRTGAITPVAEFDPVHIGGSTVRRATLHNYDEVARKDIRVGDTVFVEKGGDVIPKVTGVVMEERPSKSRPLAIPHACPICGEPVHRFESEVAIRCSNAGCPAIVREALLHYAGRKAMDIEGLGEKVVDALIAADLARDYTSLYELREDDLLQLEGFAKKKASKLLEQIENSKRRELARLIFAIGIRFVGERSARLLADRFHSIEVLMDATTAELIEVPEVGPKVADAIVFFFSVQANRERIARLMSLGVEPHYAVQERGTKLAGKILVVTGSLERFTREEIHALIEKEGGRTSGSVSSKTSYLVAGADAGSKLEKAQKLKVPVLTEDELISLLGI